jgi:hypothetical protein
MNNQEQLIIFLGEELLKYKKKYRNILRERDSLAEHNSTLLNTQYQSNNNSKENDKNINHKVNSTQVFSTGCDENIHPFIRQEIEGEHPQNLTIKQMSDNAVSNALQDKKFPDQLADSELVFDKNNYIKQGRDNDLRNDATDFINKHFFSSDDKFYNFLINFYKVMSDALKKYITKIRPTLKDRYGLLDSYDIDKNIKLIFKGGNVLKAVYSKYKYETSGTVADNLNQLFNKYFSRSDLDYQIIIYPKLTSTEQNNKIIYEFLVDKISILVYWVMNEFRKGYIYKLEDTFDFYQLNNTCKISKLQILKNKLNSTLQNIQQSDNFRKFITTYGAEFDYYSTMKIKNIFFNNVCSDKNELEQYIKNVQTNVVENDIVKSVLNIQNKFYNYRNDIYVEDKIIDDGSKINVKTISQDGADSKCEHYITFIKNVYSNNNPNHLVRTFGLIRTKINFLAEFTSDIGGVTKYGAINVPGELIDLSISRYEDNRNKKFDSKTIDEMYTEYTFDGHGDDDFKFYSYNLEFLMVDLYEVIYADNLVPWEDIKYEKRLYRLFFFSIIELLSLNIGEPGLILFIAKLNEIKSADLDIIEQYSDYFNGLFSQITNSKIKELMFMKIFNKHPEIFTNTSQTDKNKMRHYYGTIQLLLKEIDVILSNIKIFCERPYLGKIDINDENFKILHQMGGDDSHKKYLKYKKKYLCTKNNKI